jgi:hypothetical protein
MTRAVLLLCLVAAACRGEPDKKKEDIKWLPVERVAPAPAPPAIDAGPARPAGVSDENVEAADAVHAWFKTLAAAARGHASDCLGMARAIESVGAKGRPIVARAKAMQKEMKDPAAAAWFADYNRARMEAGYNDLVAAMGLCAENATVKKAMKAIAK